MECPRYEQFRLKLLENVLGYNAHLDAYSPEQKYNQ